MTWWEAILMGVLQGLTEFLPVSSSGHLVLAQHFLGTANPASAPIALEVFLHTGTMASVLVAFRKELLSIALSMFQGLKRFRHIQETFAEDPFFRTGTFLFCASLPAGILGVLFKDNIEKVFNTPSVACLGLFVTGLLLLATRFIPTQGRPITVRTACWIGLAQAAAMMPGISRSGATISTGLLRKVPRDVAARFSFYLSVPAVLGATLLQLLDAKGSNQDLPWMAYALGALVSFGVGWVAIHTVMIALKKERFYLFGIYCLLVATICLILLWYRPGLPSYHLPGSQNPDTFTECLPT